MFPIHLNLGFRVFYYYEGFYFLAAIAIGFGLAVRRLGQAGLDPTLFEDSLIWILLGALLGARSFHFLFWDWQTFRADPMVFFRFWEGGLTITGGLGGGVLAAVICLRRGKADFWAYSAVVSPAVLVGQAIGRVGCFLNGDAWGVPTRLPWGVREPRFGHFFPSFRPDLSMPSNAWEWCVAKGYAASSSLATPPLHPTQLYESLGDLLLAGLVILQVRALARRGGPRQAAIWLHLGGYSLLRFALEFLHGDRDAIVAAGMTWLQIGLLAFGIVSAGLYLGARRLGSAAPAPSAGR
jgi:phosphatidylglycerol:prolipoprotein diacylglycerol transferase